MTAEPTRVEVVLSRRGRRLLRIAGAAAGAVVAAVILKPDYTSGRLITGNPRWPRG